MTQQTYPIKCRIRNEDAGTTRIDIFDDIGGGGWFDDGLTAKSFAAQMSGIKGALEVHINSGGGDVFDGIAIGNAIRAHKGPVTTVVDGLAASIASVIAQAGQERVVQPGSMFMIHDAFGACMGDAAEMAKMAETLDTVSGNIATIYADRSGSPAAGWRDAMKAETWYTAEEAVAAGLADKVGDGAAELPAGLDVAAFTAVPGRIAAALRKLPQATAPAVPQDAAAPVIEDAGHAPMTGSHGHAHTANGDQGGDATHDHDHTHDGDADHGHSHAAQGKAAKVKGKKAGKKAAKKTRIKGDAAGACCSLCGPDCACGGQPAARAPRRILGLESMPLTNEALPVHHTGTVDTPWDGPAAVAGMPNDAKVLRYCHAWQDSASDDGTGDDPDGDADDKKASWKFPHHTKKGGPANLAACRNGLARLSGADIPDGDRAGVQKHLQAHLDDGGSDSDDAGNHAHPDLSGQLEQIRAALKGANE